MKNERYCCFIGCDKSASYEIDYVENEDPYTQTDACAEHLAELIGDSIHVNVYRFSNYEAVQ